MPQNSDPTATTDERAASIPQERDDELETADEEDEEFEDDENADEEDVDEDEEVAEE
jgi:hypothetical protein